MSGLNKLKELVKLHTREFDLHKADPRSPSKLAAWDYASSLLNDEIDRDAVGLVTQILGGLEAAQQRIAEMESERTSTNTELARIIKRESTRATVAEAEIARRDAAAGEPVGYTNIAGLEALSKGFVVSVCPDARQIEPLPLYTHAHPSALPPEMTRDVSNYDVVDHGFISGYNQAIADAKALGCKAIKLPEPYDDGHGNEWLPRRATIQTLKSQGFTVEGE